MNYLKGYGKRLQLICLNRTGNINNGLSRRTEIQQQYYNRNAKVLKPLNTGDTARVRKPEQKTWTPAVVTRVTDVPRSYVVNSEGASHRRNRRDLIKTTEATNQERRLKIRKQTPQVQSMIQ